MTLTPSSMLPLGTAAPHFELIDTDGRRVSLSDYAGKPLLVLFICNHCPYVKHVAAELARIGRDYKERIGIVAISSNDVESYPADSPAMMQKEKEERGYNFPYLFDESQEVARAYHAACTPDPFLFDSAHRLRYRGQLDSSRPSNTVPVTGADIRAAIDAVIDGIPVNEKQVPSVGCNIKWRPR